MEHRREAGGDFGPMSLTKVVEDEGGASPPFAPPAEEASVGGGFSRPGGAQKGTFLGGEGEGSSRGHLVHPPPFAPQIRWFPEGQLFLCDTPRQGLRMGF